MYGTEIKDQEFGLQIFSLRSLVFILRYADQKILIMSIGKQHTKRMDITLYFYICIRSQKDGKNIFYSISQKYQIIEMRD